MQIVEIKRRDLIIGCSLAGTACLCAASEICCLTPQVKPGTWSVADQRLRIQLPPNPDLRKVGASANIIDPTQKLDLVIVHAAAKDYRVLSGLCTHFPRPLTYLPKRRVLQCNNFNHSIFDLDGNVVKGPARRPIRKYEVRLAGDDLEVTL